MQLTDPTWSRSRSERRTNTSALSFQSDRQTDRHGAKIQASSSSSSSSPPDSFVFCSLIAHCLCRRKWKVEVNFAWVLLLLLAKAWSIPLLQFVSNHSRGKTERKNEIRYRSLTKTQIEFRKRERDNLCPFWQIGLSCVHDFSKKRFPFHFGADGWWFHVKTILFITVYLSLWGKNAVWVLKNATIVGKGYRNLF